MSRVYLFSKHDPEKEMKNVTHRVSSSLTSLCYRCNCLKKNPFGSLRFLQKNAQVGIYMYKRSQRVSAVTTSQINRLRQPARLLHSCQFESW